MATDFVPYVDFAIWGPHHNRTVKRLRCAGKIFNETGELESKEVYGPPSTHHWNASYTIMRVSFLMLDLLDLGILDSYALTINDFHAKYGEEAWLLIYQCDVRFRLEHLERIAMEINLTSMRAGVNTMDYKVKWRAAWRRAMADKEWWSEEMVEPAQALLLKLAKARNFIGGDAAVASSAADHFATTTTALSSYSPPVLSAYRPTEQQVPRGRGIPDRAKTTDRGKRPAAQPRSIANGVYITTGTGGPLCPYFQKGTCRTTGNQCAAGAHQCEKCLKNCHGSANTAKCPNSNAPPTQSRKQQKREQHKCKGAGKAKGPVHW